MKFFRRKGNRKNRTIVTGILVGIASIIVVTVYVDIPREQVIEFLVATFMFVLGIILLAVVAIIVLKTLVYIGKKISSHDQQEAESSDKE